MAGPGGATRVAAVIGDPIGHSVSPAIHNAGFEAAGLDWVFVAFAVPAGGAGGALAAVRALGLGGLSVTTPHKDAVAALVDRLSPTAAALGAVNTVVPAGGDLVGDSTDGAGFVAWLRRDEELDPAGPWCWRWWGPAPPRWSWWPAATGREPMPWWRWPVGRREPAGRRRSRRPSWW